MFEAALDRRMTGRLLVPTTKARSSERIPSVWLNSPGWSNSVVRFGGFQPVPLSAVFTVGAPDQVAAMVVQKEHGRGPEELAYLVELVQEPAGPQGSVVFICLQEPYQLGIARSGSSSFRFLGIPGVVPSSSAIRLRASS